MPAGGLVSWYKATVPHNRIRRDVVVWLEDTPDVVLRVEKGLLEPADEPAWHANLAEEDKWNFTTTAPYQ